MVCRAFSWLKQWLIRGDGLLAEIMHVCQAASSLVSMQSS